MLKKIIHLLDGKPIESPKSLKDYSINAKKNILSAWFATCLFTIFIVAVCIISVMWAPSPNLGRMIDFVYTPFKLLACTILVTVVIFISDFRKYDLSKMKEWKGFLPLYCGLFLVGILGLCTIEVIENDYLNKTHAEQTAIWNIIIRDITISVIGSLLIGFMAIVFPRAIKPSFDAGIIPITSKKRVLLELSEMGKKVVIQQNLLSKLLNNKDTRFRFAVNDFMNEQIGIFKETLEIPRVKRNKQLVSTLTKRNAEWVRIRNKMDYTKNPHEIIGILVEQVNEDAETIKNLFT